MSWAKQEGRDRGKKKALELLEYTTMNQWQGATLVSTPSWNALITASVGMLAMGCC